MPGGFRSFVAETDKTAVFFDGVPVLAPSASKPHASDVGPTVSADMLLRHRDSIPQHREGECVVTVVDKARRAVTLFTDPFGLRPCFLTRHEGAVLISNSVRALVLCRGHQEPDPEGVAGFLSLGWLDPPLTLQRGIERLAPGHAYAFDGVTGTLSVRSYFDLASLRHERDTLRQQSPAARIQHLVAVLKAWFDPLMDSYAESILSLTGGKDSRVLLGLAKAGGTTIQCMTRGAIDHEDVRLASALTARHGMPHEVRGEPGWPMPEDPWEAITPFVTHTDGQANLMLLTSFHGRGRFRSIPLVFSGNGGEVARGYFSRPLFGWLHRSGMLEAREALSQFQRRTVPVDPAAFAASQRRCLDRHLRLIREAGFEDNDAGDLFYLRSRIGGWMANNRLILRSFQDVVSPLCARAFVGEALARSYLQRCQESLHHDLLRALDPDLLETPFTKPFPSQNAAVAMAQDALGWMERGAGRAWRRLWGRAAGRSSGPGSPSSFRPDPCPWLAPLLSDLLDACRDPGSPLHGHVDRAGLEAFCRDFETGGRRSKRDLEFAMTMANIVAAHRSLRDSLAEFEADQAYGTAPLARPA